MPFDLKIVFTGLVLVCTPGEKPCDEVGKDGIAYLVNATQGKEICGRWMDGGHHPLLAFDERNLLPGSTQKYEYIPVPGGERSIVADLRGIDLCVCTAAPGEPADCTRPPVTLEPGRGNGQVHPKWYKFDDADGYGWLPDLPSADERVAACGYRAEVNEPLRRGHHDNDAVISRVRLAGGKLKVQGCAHHRIDNPLEKLWRKLFSLDYVVWDLTGEYAGTNLDFPKALPDQVVWKISNIPSNHLVLLQTCADGRRPPRTLFRLQRAGFFGDLEVHISNLPSKSVQSTPGPHLEHFRWFYSLVDWSSKNGGCIACEERDVVLPTPETIPPLDPNAIWGVTSKTAHCSPGDS